MYRLLPTLASTDLVDRTNFYGLTAARTSPGGSLKKAVEPEPTPQVPVVRGVARILYSVFKTTPVVIVNWVFPERVPFPQTC